jgi:peptide chain release factor 2
LPPSLCVPQQTDCIRHSQAVSEAKLQISDAKRIAGIVSDAETALELLNAQDEASDVDLLREASGFLETLEAALDAWELERLLDMPYASSSAILTITAGAGGTDAQARSCAWSTGA